ncbi:MAG: TolC family protein [Pseudomonadota bacterium]
MQSSSLTIGAFLHHTATLGLTACAYLASATSVHAYSLVESYERAKLYDAQIKVAASSLALDSESKVQAASALKPQVNARLSLAHARSKTSIAGAPRTGSSKTFRTNAQVSLTQDLFNLDKWYRLRSSQASHRRAQAEYGSAVQSLLNRVTSAYFDVLVAAANLENDRAAERALFSERKRITLYYDNGELSINDLYEAQAASDLSKATRINSEHQLSISKQTLTGLTGEPIQNPWTLSERFPLQKLKINSAEQWANMALAKNWSIIASQHELDSLKDNASSARYRHYPTVDTQFSLSTAHNDGPAFTTNDDEDSQQSQRNASININIPLYNSGLTNSQQRAAEAQVDMKRHSHTQLTRNVSQESKRLFLSYDALILQIRAQRNALKSARSLVKTTTFGYENGLRKTTDLLNAQSNLYKAKRDYDKLRLDLLRTKIALKTNTGTLNAHDLSEINRWLTPPKNAIVRTKSYTLPTPSIPPASTSYTPQTKHSASMFSPISQFRSKLSDKIKTTFTSKPKSKAAPNPPPEFKPTPKPRLKTASRVRATPSVRKTPRVKTKPRMETKPRKTEIPELETFYDYQRLRMIPRTDAPRVTAARDCNKQWFNRKSNC